MKRFIIEKSKDEFYTSHSGAALIGRRDALKKLNNFKLVI
jgi:hypothetical protein